MTYVVKDIVRRN